MPSRKSPSQRDPMTRMSQAVRAGSPASMGGRVANAAPVTASATAKHRTVTPTAGGGPLGAAFISYTWTGTALSNHADYNSSGVTINAIVGDMGAFATPGAPVSGLFFVFGTLKFQPTTNALSSDVHMMHFGFPGGSEQSGCAVGTEPALLWGSNFTSGYYGPDTTDCYLNARCTGGTNRVYDGPPGSPTQPLTLDVAIARFPAV